jgi:hypothetical protein
MLKAAVPPFKINTCVVFKDRCSFGLVIGIAYEAMLCWTSA